jgi:hypothetical protein
MPSVPCVPVDLIFRGVWPVMAKNLRLVLLVVPVVLTLAYVNEAAASITTSLRSWTLSPTVTGDATWNFISLTNMSPTTVPVTFNETTSNGTENFVLTLGDSSHLLAPGVYELKYSITLDPGAVFQTASLGVNLTGVFPAATVTKYLYVSPTASTPFATLSSVNGKSVSTGAVAGLSSLYVDEIVSVTGGAIASFANSFTPTVAVPEPASLAVWVILGAGIAIVCIKCRRMATST